MGRLHPKIEGRGVMRSFSRAISIGMLPLIIEGCAGAAPNPVAVVQPQDKYMDCAAIMAEVQANNAKVQQLAGDEGLKTAQNVAAGVAGFIIPVLSFGMDFQGSASKEVTALQ